MKKLLLAITLSVVVVPFAMAQTEKGRVMIGGNASFDMNDDRVTTSTGIRHISRYTEFTFNPNVGYFFTRGLVGGVGLNFLTSKHEPENDLGLGAVKSTGISVAPFARYYLRNGLFGVASVEFGTQKTTISTDIGDQDQEYDTNGWQAGIGYAIFLNKNIALEPIVFYQSSTLKYPNTGAKTTNDGISASLGFNIFLR